MTDPENLLEGTGKRMRQVKIRSLEELEQRQEALRAMIYEAVRLNEGE